MKLSCMKANEITVCISDTNITYVQLSGLSATFAFEYDTPGEAYAHATTFTIVRKLIR